MSEIVGLGYIARLRAIDLETQSLRAEETKKLLADRMARHKALAGSETEQKEDSDFIRYKSYSPVNLEAEQKKYSISDDIKRVAEENLNYTDSEGKIVLPAEVLALIDNKQFLNMYKCRAREWGMNTILKAVEVAKSQAEKPSHYFARMLSKKNKENTYKWLRTLISKAENMAKKLKKVGTNLAYVPYYLMAESLLGKRKFSEIMGCAVKAEKPSHYFASAIASELRN